MVDTKISGPICFYLNHSDDEIRNLADRLNESLLPRLLGGRNCWIVQSYLHLKAAGYDVALSNRVTQGSVVVYHGDDRRRVYKGLRRSVGAILVSVRADRLADAFADYEIVQSGYFADGKRIHHIPHWPQPGLIARDPRRGSTIEHVGFKGALENLCPELHSNSFRAELENRRMRLNLDVRFDGEFDESMNPPFVDYRDTDVIVAIRRAGTSAHRNKPASKLVNSWHAGVPAILGHEFAYQEVRRTPKDYLEATDVKQVLGHLDTLRSQPALYNAMIENGRVRAREYNFDSITARWIRVLENIRSGARIMGRIERGAIGLARRLRLQLTRELD